MTEHALEENFLTQLGATGLIAILRGIRPEEAPAIGAALYETGFKIIEIPMNSPDALTSIKQLATQLPDDAIVGAGTVMTPARVQDVHKVGGRLIVMPHADTEVIRAAADAGLIVLPGVATPTEAFAALAAGATGLKAFPAEALPPTVIKAWRAVIPHDIPLLPVGGITPDKIQDYLEAGASGFGLGGALYRPGNTVDTVRKNAQAFMAAWRQAKGRG